MVVRWLALTFLVFRVRQCEVKRSHNWKGNNVEQDLLPALLNWKRHVNWLVLLLLLLAILLFLVPSIVRSFDAKHLILA